MRKPKPLPRLRLVHSSEAQSQKYYVFKHLPSRYYEGDLVCTEISGDSLARAGVPRGHMVAVVKGAAVSSGGLVSVNLCDEPNNQCVRYAYFGPGGWVRLQSADRDEYPDLIYGPGDFEIIGPVVHAEPSTPRWK